jgi:cyclophilin family peptidyl-prolyl cis-trans isomerase
MGLFMRKSSKGIVAFIGLTITSSAQIVADFQTSRGEFSVVLDHVNAPLATANFIHLAGKGDDVFETRNGVPFLEDPTHNRHLYSTIAESDSVKLPLTVSYVPISSTMRAHYEIKQSGTFIGAVETFLLSSYYADVTGQDRVRLQFVNSKPTRYRITLRYPRSWIDARDQRVKNTPMYRNLKINRVETGKRFFAGSMTESLLENPGSRFFITSAADRSWNGKYTAFGTVVRNAGRSVVLSIANSLTDSNGLPSNEMSIDEITFRRGGDAAAFFESYHQSFMPGQIEELCMGFNRSGSQVSLVTPWKPSTLTTLYQSTDLINYLAGAFEAQSPASTGPVYTNLTDAVVFAPKLFVKGFATVIPHWFSGDMELKNARFALEVNSGIDQGSLELTFSEDGVTGSYSIDMLIEQTAQGQDPVIAASIGSGTFAAQYSSESGPYKGTLTFTNVTGPLNVGELTLHFESTRYANNPLVNQSAIIRRFDARTTNPEVPFLSYSGIYRKVR